MKTNQICSRTLMAALLSVATVAGANEHDTATRADQASATNRTDRTYSQSYDRSQYSASANTTTTAGQLQKADKASGLIGMNVKDQAGEKVGDIKDLVIDFNSGKIAYAVLAADNGLLRAGRLHAVPLDAFQRSADGRYLTLNVDKERLAQSEGFDRNNWPSATTPVWGAESPWQRDVNSDATRTDRERMKRDLDKDVRDGSRTLDQNRQDPVERNTPPVQPDQQK